MPPMDRETIGGISTGVSLCSGRVCVLPYSQNAGVASVVIGLQDNAKVSVFPVVEHTICHHRIQKLFPQNVILGGYPIGQSRHIALTLKLLRLSNASMRLLYAPDANQECFLFLRVYDFFYNLPLIISEVG